MIKTLNGFISSVKCGHLFSYSLFNSVFFSRYLQLTRLQLGIMSYGSIDGNSFGSRNPFGGPTRQGYQPVGKNPCFYESSTYSIKMIQCLISNLSQYNNSHITGTTQLPELLFCTTLTQSILDLVSHNSAAFVKWSFGDFIHLPNRRMMGKLYLFLFSCQF